MKILGISLGHDTNFALIENEEITAMIEVERFYRQKRYKLHCIETSAGKHTSGFQLVDVKELVDTLQSIKTIWGSQFNFIALQNQGRNSERTHLEKIMHEVGFSYSSLISVNHHLSHASLAYFTSPFPESLILSYDGFGNDGQTVLFKAQGNKIDYLENVPTQFGNSYNNLGFIIGVSPDVSGTSSGKTMGLAAYGKTREDWLPSAREYVKNYRKLTPLPVEGLNNYGNGHQTNSVGLTQIQELKGFIKHKPRYCGHGWKGLCKRLMEGWSNPEIRLGGVDDPLAQDLANTVQRAWTEELLAMIKSFQKHSNNLCIVGGCALNGVANYALQQTGWFKKIHFVPNPTDCGLSAGAGLYVHYQRTQDRFSGKRDYPTPYLGLPPFDLDKLPELKKQYPHCTCPEDILPKILAEHIFKDRIVGVIRGRYEIGPRALGNRSILCNPLHPKMRDILNEKVKHREWYRPFAPVATAEDAPRFFTNIDDIPYMSVICFVKPEYRKKLPSITHVDGSARLQTLHKPHNPFLYESLKAFETLSGMPIFLNTSFNPGGEPIVNYCSVGLEMLNKTNMDLVLIENTFFCRKGREDLLSSNI